ARLQLQSHLNDLLTKSEMPKSIYVYSCMFLGTALHALNAKKLWKKGHWVSSIFLRDLANER
ncbi:hypothetical protein, partial [Helicobacter suis]|uniref:hypothetical protein n=1 Tax=Helicobacter suis TaxID=104628 RepID=UPI00196715E4